MAYPVSFFSSHGRDYAPDKPGYPTFCRGGGPRLKEISI